jgi:hypothetical protein
MVRRMHANVMQLMPVSQGEVGVGVLVWVGCGGRGGHE